MRVKYVFCKNVTVKKTFEDAAGTLPQTAAIFLLKYLQLYVGHENAGISRQPDPRRKLLARHLQWSCCSAIGDFVYEKSARNGALDG
jgi:hypothetical protein